MRGAAMPSSSPTDQAVGRDKYASAFPAFRLDDNLKEAKALLPRARKQVVKTTKYFRTIRKRPDRSMIKDEWIEQAMKAPEREHVQADGRIRRWGRIAEMEGRYLRVILLPDGETVHNAFFDRGFKP
ncbi:hypothetical protein PC39_08184 [Salinisphaera sp. PC39]